MTSLQLDVALDATLAILLKVLCTAPPAQGELSHDIIISLTTVLPLICSAHPDASARHITFCILGQVLQLAPSLLRLQILRDLVSPSEDASPYMRTAAIGLVKDAVLEALSDPKAENVFASPFLLQTLGPHVFRLEPPNLLASFSEVDALKNNPEPMRLVGCLNLYYILLSRDTDNRVRVFYFTLLRGSEEMDAVRLALGTPEPCKVYSRPYLRQYTQHSVNGTPVSSAYSHAKNCGTHKIHHAYLVEALPLAALQISLDRVEDALKALT